MERRLIELVSSYQLPLNDEKAMQAAFAEVLQQEGIEFVREHRLSPKDIPDFFIDGIAVECKLKGNPKRRIFSQLQRYARHDEVRSILLITNVSMGLPEMIEDKPAFYVGLGKAWL